MQKTKGKLRGLTLFLVIVMCFAVLMSQTSSKGESNSTKNLWEFFMDMERTVYLITPAVDGYSWREMSELQKYGYIVGYVRGFQEGVVSAWAYATADTSAKNWHQWPFNISLIHSYEELVEAVDEFYSDYANRGVCLSLALPIIINRMRGYISDKEAEERIQKARKSSFNIRKK